MVGFWGDTDKIVELFEEHENTVESCLEKFIKTIELYIDEGGSQKVKSISKEVHSLETEADIIRRKIIKLLIKEKYLLPNTRRDFLNLLEYLDKVADYAEAALDYVILQDMDISDIGKNYLSDVLDMTLKQYKLLKKAVKLLFENIDDAYDYVTEIEEIESQIDDIERILISRISKRDELSYGLKSLYRDFVTMIANISDVIEDAGDEIELIIAMRKI